MRRTATTSRSINGSRSAGSGPARPSRCAGSRCWWTGSRRRCPTARASSPTWSSAPPIASSGVISIWTDPTAPRTVRQDVRVLFGTFDRDLNRNWNKWQSSTSFRVGSGSALVTVSRLDYTGQRQHSDADFRNLSSRWHFPLAPGWSLAAKADVGWDPRADNPGALTNNEMRVNRDSAARLNIVQVAGKDVTQGQAGVTVRREFARGGEASLTVFGITRRLENPTTFAYIDLKRFDYGARFSVSRPLPLGSLEQRLTAGVDFQRQRDDRLNFNNVEGT